MKRYYIISPMNDLEYIGEFPEFKDAWEHMEYDSNKRFVWIISENSIRKLQSQFNSILENRSSGLQ